MTNDRIDLNHLRDLINQQARGNRVPSEDAAEHVYVEPSGAVVLADTKGERRHLSEVHPGVFAGSGPTSERALLPTVREAAAPTSTGSELVPYAPNSPVFVDPDGKVTINGTSGDRRQLSEVHPGVFCAATAEDAATAREKLPPGARWVDDGHARGWMFDITNDFGDQFTFFVYRQGDHGLYYAMMVYPEVPSAPDPHVAHYFRSGRLCLAPEIGLPTLEACYAKSVIFSLGWSTFTRTGTFPFAGQR